MLIDVQVVVDSARHSIVVWLRSSSRWQASACGRSHADHCDTRPGRCGAPELVDAGRSRSRGCRMVTRRCLASRPAGSQLMKASAGEQANWSRIAQVAPSSGALRVQWQRHLAAAEQWRRGPPPGGRLGAPVHGPPPRRFLSAGRGRKSLNLQNDIDADQFRRTAAGAP